MTGPVFVDTNIWLYARDTRDARKHRIACDWLDKLWQAAQGRTSLQVVNEYYANVTRKLARPMSREDAWEDVEMMLAWRPRPQTADMLKHARELEVRHRLSWWDALVVASAAAEDCDLLLSEDLQHGQVLAGIRVCNPFAQGISDADWLPSPRRSRRTRLVPAPRTR
jgi:predicted nucleic acid-binding protein